MVTVPPTRDKMGSAVPIEIRLQRSDLAATAVNLEKANNPTFGVTINDPGKKSQSVRTGN